MANPISGTISLLLSSLLYAAHLHAQPPLSPWVPQAQKIGEAHLSYLFWDIYQATLYAPQGQFQPEQAFALELSYLRAIKGREIADQSIVEIRSQGFNDEIKLATWHSQLRQIFPDVHKGISLTGIYNGRGKTIFLQNNTEIGHIDDAEFSRAFFAIWLGENTRSPRLRRQLLGQ